MRARDRESDRREREREIQYCTFLQTHVYHAGLGQLQEEVLVFLILLIVNNFHVNNFAARGREKWGGGGGGERGVKGKKGERRTEKKRRIKVNL